MGLLLHMGLDQSWLVAYMGYWIFLKFFWLGRFELVTSASRGVVPSQLCCPLSYIGSSLLHLLPKFDEKLYFFILVSTAVTYDKSIKAIRVKVPDSDEEFLLHPATVRRNDRSAQSVVWRGFFGKLNYIF